MPQAAPPLDSAEARALYGLLSSSLRATAPSNMTALETMNERLRVAATARAQEQAAMALGGGNAPPRLITTATSSSLPPPPPPHFSKSFIVRAVNDVALSAALRAPADRAGALASPALEGTRIRFAGWRGSFVLCAADGFALRTIPQPLLLAALETLNLLPLPTLGGPSKDLVVTRVGARGPVIASLLRTRTAHVKVRTAAESGVSSEGAALSWIVGSDANTSNNNTVKLTGEAPLYAMRSCIAIGAAALSIDFSIVLPLALVLTSREGTLSRLAAVLKAMGPLNEWPSLASGGGSGSGGEPVHAVAAVALTLYFSSGKARDDWAAALSFLSSIEISPPGARITVRGSGGPVSAVSDPPFAPHDADADDDDVVIKKVENKVVHDTHSKNVLAAPVARRAPPAPPSSSSSSISYNTLPAALAALENAFDVRLEKAEKLGPLLRASRRESTTTKLGLGPPTSDDFPHTAPVLV